MIPSLTTCVINMCFVGLISPPIKIKMSRRTVWALNTLQVQPLLSASTEPSILYSISNYVATDLNLKATKLVSLSNKYIHSSCGFLDKVSATICAMPVL